MCEINSMTIAVGTELQVTLAPESLADISITYDTQVPGMRYALAAYALRRLTLAHRGPVARVRRVTDNAETDVYEYRDDLWTARFGRGLEIRTWASGSALAIAAWHDQSGHKRNALQRDPAAQPLLLYASSGGYSASFGNQTAVLLAPSEAIPNHGYCVTVQYADDLVRRGTLLAVSDSATPPNRQPLLSGSTWTDPDGSGSSVVVPRGRNVSISYDPSDGSLSAISDDAASPRANTGLNVIVEPERFDIGDNASLGKLRFLEIGGSDNIKKIVIFDRVTSAPEFSLTVPPPSNGLERFVSSNVTLGTEALIVHGISAADSRRLSTYPLLSKTSSNANLFNQDRIRHLAAGHIWQVSDKTIILPAHGSNHADDPLLGEARFQTAMAIEGETGVPGAPGDLYVWSRTNMSNVLRVSSNTTIGGPTWIQDQLLATGKDTILSNSAHLDAYAPSVTFSNAEMFVGRDLLVRGTTYATTPSAARVDAAFVTNLNAAQDCGLSVVASSNTKTARIGLGTQAFLQSTVDAGVSVHLASSGRRLWLASNGCMAVGDTTYVPDVAQLDIRPTPHASNAVLAFQDASRGGLRHTIRTRHAEVVSPIGDALDVFLNASSPPFGPPTDALALTVSRAGLWTPTHIAVGRHSNSSWASDDVPYVKLDDQPSTRKLVLLDPAAPSITSFHGLGATLEEVQYRAPSDKVDHVFYVGSNGSRELMRLSANGLELARGGLFHGACNVDAATAYFLADIQVIDTVPARVLRNLDQAHLNLPMNEPVITGAPSAALRSHAIAARIGGGIVMYANNSSQGASVTVSALDVSHSNTLGVTGSNDVLQWGMHGSSNAYIRATSCNGLELQVPCLRASDGTSLRLRSGSDSNLNAITISRDNKVGIALSNGLLPSTGYALEVTGDVFASGDVLARSDARTKSNVEVIEDALAKVATLRGVTYSLCNDPYGRRSTGLIAQEVQAVLPEAVKEDADTGLLSVAYGNVIGLLVEAIHQLESRINDGQKYVSSMT